jgi:hypothetical protein
MDERKDDQEPPYEWVSVGLGSMANVISGRSDALQFILPFRDDLVSVFLKVGNPMSR